jgi:5-methylthioadenosine/S-adenosylhomocysteine deaminase
MDNQRRIIRDGAVVVDKDRIVAVGQKSEMERNYAFEDKFGGEDFVILPGLINTHCHTEASIYRGLCDDMSLMEFKKHVLSKTIPNYAPGDVYVASLVSLIESVRNGVTTILDVGVNKEESAEAAKRMGTRSIVAEAMMDCSLGEAEGPVESTEIALRKGVRLFERWNGVADGRIKVWFGPFTELLTSPELLEKTVALADRYRTGITMHLAESYETQSIIKRTYGRRIFEYLEHLGILGPNLLAVHCCWLSENEIRLMKKANVKVSHCPSANMKLSDGVAPLSLLDAYGIILSIGTDSALCNNCNDLLREAKTASLLQKVAMPPLDTQRISAQRALEMITIDAARCALLDQDIGSLEPGKKADLVLIDIKKSHLMPVLEKPKVNIVGNLVYAGSGHDVDTVMIDGNIVMRGRAILNLDERTILDQFQEASETLLERSKIV